MKRFKFLYLLPGYLLLATPAWAGYPPTICAIEGVISGLISVALGLGGFALFIMIIMSAYKWLTAGTNVKAVQEARNGIFFAILGMFLMFGAWFLLIFIREFTGVDVTVFEIPGC